MYSYEFDNNPHEYGVGYVAIFIFNCELTHYSGETRELNIYVKLKCINNKLPVLSMHESKGE